MKKCVYLLRSDDGKSTPAETSQGLLMRELDGGISRYVRAKRKIVVAQFSDIFKQDERNNNPQQSSFDLAVSGTAQTSAS